MDSRDPLRIRLWFLAFRALSLGLLVIGVLAAVFGIIIAVVALLPQTQPTPGLSFGYGLLCIALGVTFAVAGVRGFKMRTRRDVDAELSKTSSDRNRLERWINR